jgi:hypothetical protein
MEDTDNLIAFYRARRAELDPSDGSRWYLLIKEIRLLKGCGIDEAHAIALTDPAWRRWLEQQINSNPACRKAALRHIRRNGDASIIAQQDERLAVR